MTQTLLLLGATGDLSRKKIIPNIASINAKIIAYGRKERPAFLESVTYIQGSIDELKEKFPENITHVFVALPPFEYEKTLRELGEIKKIHPNLKIAIEKPFGISYEDALQLLAIVRIFHMYEDVYLVDHYLAKESLRESSQLQLEPFSTTEVEFLETDTVVSRGAFYDRIGVVRDVVQSHVLLSLSEYLRDRTLGDYSKARAKVLENLRYVDRSIYRAQYEGYLDTPGVESTSSTETFVKMVFTYEKSTIIVTCGKATDRSVSRIGDLVLKGDSHAEIVNDFLGDNWKYKIAFEEVLQAWRLIENVTLDMQSKPVHIYKQGSSPDDIIKQ